MKKPKTKGKLFTHPKTKSSSSSSKLEKIEHLNQTKRVERFLLEGCNLRKDPKKMGDSVKLRMFRFDGHWPHFARYVSGVFFVGILSVSSLGSREQTSPFENDEIARWFNSCPFWDGKNVTLLNGWKGDLQLVTRGWKSHELNHLVVSVWFFCFFLGGGGSQLVVPYFFFWDSFMTLCFFWWFF